MENFDRIDKYLKGKLSKSESIAFEKELTNNLDLREEYEFQKLEEEMIGFAARKDIAEDLSKAKALPQKNKSKRRLYITYISIGAVAASLLLILLFYPWKNSSKIPYAQIAGEEIKSNHPYNIFSNYRNTAAPITTPLDSALRYFDFRKDFNFLIDSLSKTNLNLGINQYLLGSVYFNQEDYQNAASYFDLARKNNPTYSKIEEWSDYYYLLSLMLKDASSIAINSTIEEILDKGIDHAYYPKVRNIKTQIIK